MAKVTISIPDNIVPKECEAVEFRSPDAGETYLTYAGDTAIACGRAIGPRLILLRKWEWPRVFKFDKLQHYNQSEWAWFVKGEQLGYIDFAFLDIPEPPDRTKVYRNPKQP